MLFSYRSGYSKIKFQSIDEKKVFATGFMIRGFFFVFSGAIFGIRWFESFDSKKNRKWIYGNLKKVRREKSGEISRNLRFSRFFSVGSKST